MSYINQRRRHKTSWFETGKRDSFIHQTNTETYNMCRPPFCEPGLGSSLQCSKNTFNRNLLTIFLSPQGRGMDWVEEKGLNEGMLRKLLTKDWKCLGKEGSEIGQSFTFLMLGCEMRPKHLLLYDKMMVIRLGGWAIAGELVGKPTIAC